MPEQFLSVAEFSKLAGVSKQAVYSRLDSQEIVKFVKVDSSGKKPKKLISTTAIPLFKSKEVNQVDSQVDSTNDKLIDSLQEQLQEKDKTIAALLDQVQQLQTQNQDLSSHLIDQGHDIAKLLDQQQQLQAMYMQQLTLTAAKAEQPSEAAPATEKKGILSRLFGW